MKKKNLHFCLVLTVLFMLISIKAFSTTVTITPTGADDSAGADLQSVP